MGPPPVPAGRVAAGLARSARGPSYGQPGFGVVRHTPRCIADRDTKRRALVRCTVRTTHSPRPVTASMRFVTRTGRLLVGQSNTKRNRMQHLDIAARGLIPPVERSRPPPRERSVRHAIRHTVQDHSYHQNALPIQQNVRSRSLHREKKEAINSGVFVWDRGGASWRTVGGGVLISRLPAARGNTYPKST